MRKPKVVIAVAAAKNWDLFAVLRCDIGSLDPVVFGRLPNRRSYPGITQSLNGSNGFTRYDPGGNPGKPGAIRPPVALSSGGITAERPTLAGVVHRTPPIVNPAIAGT
jgi:hypothetical protein